MMKSASSLVALAALLSGGETLALTSTKLGTRRSKIIMPVKNTGLSSKLMSKRKTKVSGVDRYDFQSSTRLPSTYVGARHTPRFSMLPLMHKKIVPFRRWASKQLQGRRSKRLVGIMLAIIVVFGPAFSPSARAAASTSAVGGISPATMPFSTRSRALGTFNLIPSKAELELCFRLLYAACSGAFVGLERSSSDRPAGVRTMALVGLGACTFAICSTHGFLPHSALGHAPGSPYLANVKCDISRMAANVASGVGFIGAGAIHKSKLHGNGTHEQNVVAGLTTAAAIWVSAAVGIASAVGLYFVGAVATFSTVAILKYARVSPKEEEPGFDWKPRPLAVDAREESRPRRKSSQEYARSPSRQPNQDISGLFGTQHVVSGYDPQNNAFVDQDILESYSNDPRPIIIKEVMDPRFERYLQSQLDTTKNEGHGIVEQRELQSESKVLIEEEQQVVSYNVTESDQDTSIEP